MLTAVITTIQPPTPCVLQLIERLIETNGRLIVIGDKKGPFSYAPPENQVWPVSFFSLEAQKQSSFSLGNSLPEGSYARKNLGYLEAIQSGSQCIYETDDDNAPNTTWVPRTEDIEVCRVLKKTEQRWINVYRYFSKELIWPRGLPLETIHDELPSAETSKRSFKAPIQQGLVNGSPDVDAIWRLALDKPFSFDPEAPLYLSPGNWCPFNTQSTWWWPIVYPLLYIPSHCSFRMCDIWKSLIAQRCLWELDLGILFTPPEVDQDRNIHSLMNDFADEIPGYLKNDTIAKLLESVDLKQGEDHVAANLLHCYEHLVRHQIFPEAELALVNDWLKDLAKAQSRS